MIVDVRRALVISGGNLGKEGPMLRISLFVLLLGSAGSAIAQNSYSFADFGCDDSNDTRAFGINDSNLIVGATRSMGLHGFVYDGDSCGTVEPQGSSNSRVRGINPAAVMVGFYFAPGLDFVRGFMRINEFSYQDIVPPGAQDAYALGINSLNQVTGGYFDADGNEHSFILDGDMYIAPLDCPGFLNTQVNGIDDTVRIVGWCDDGVTTQAAIYDGAMLTLFQCPGAANTGAMAINNDGVVVGWYDTPDTAHGFITTDMGKSCTTIDFPDAANTQLNGISPSGTLVGFYFDDEGSYVRSFLATPKQL